MKMFVVTCLGLLSVFFTTPGNSAEVASPVVLVASVTGVETYGETVILALPIGNGGHFGFVLNKPTEATVRDLFPDEVQSRRVTTRVDIGGPVLSDKLFALVVDSGPGVEGLRRVGPQFSVALEIDEVDKVIAEQPNNTRFFVGLVMWMPGDLEQQIKSGAWQVVAPDARIVLSAQPAMLWHRLSPGPDRYVVLSSRR